jgi:1-acyl-sn-glycerol-3-phosphate acyltransferase
MINLYPFAHNLLKPFYSLFYPMNYIGRENIPEGAAIICANHSSYSDPFFAAFAFGKKRMLHFMGKAELFKNPIVKWVLEHCGAFAVNRGENDLGAIKTAMKYLKSGEKVFIFPEGTRVSEDDAVSAKTGAVRLAGKLGVPIVPLYIPRKKIRFKRDSVIIGKPFYVEKVTKENATQLSDQLMDQINHLKPETI